MRYKIAIIGGSITGCMLAQLLKRNANIQVQVFERSSSELASRGVGLTLPLSSINEINLLISDRPCHFYRMEKRVFYTENVSNQQSTVTEIWRQPVAAAAMNWGMLYETLRHGLDDIYHSSCEVRDIKYSSDSLPVIELADGHKESFDAVICADGYHSLGKKILYPQCQLDYAGYIAWRGTFAVPEVYDTTDLEYHCFAEGHFVSIAIPGKEGSLINWLLYTKMEPAELTAFMRIQKPSQPLTESAYAKLILLSKKHLPKQKSDIIECSSNLFYQVIYDAIVPSVSHDRVVLMGDAAKVLRPHLGSGATEGIRQAFALAHQIESAACLDEAISNWTASENIQSQKTMTLARCVGEALVTKVPDWGTMDHKRMESWWSSVIAGQSWYMVDDATAPKAQPDSMPASSSETGEQQALSRAFSRSRL